MNILNYTPELDIETISIIDEYVKLHDYLQDYSEETDNSLVSRLVEGCYV